MFRRSRRSRRSALRGGKSEQRRQLEELFANRLFRVPDYQRGYAWSERNWDDFLEDLDLLAPGKLHYTGTIVLDRIHKPGPGEAPQTTVTDRSGHAYEEFDIVDGQQRLAGAKGHFTGYLERQRDALGPDYATWLQQLRTKVTSNLVFVLYEVSTSAEVGVIFEVMNDRGKPLTELEKAKNYLLYLSNKLDLPEHGLTDLVNQSWAEVLSRLMRAGLSDPRYEDQLLRAHWLTVYDRDRRSYLNRGPSARRTLDRSALLRATRPSSPGVSLPPAP